MQIKDYIDFGQIYNDIKKSQLENYPTAKDYIEELKALDMPFDFVEEMYKCLTEGYMDSDATIQPECLDSELIDLDKNKIIIEWGVGGDISTENGYDYWGYSWNFTVDLELELFVDYSFENHS